MKSGKDFFGYGCAAEHMPALEHQNFLPGFRQVGGVDQAVVPAANDDHVVLMYRSKQLCITPLYRLAAGGIPSKMTRHSIEK